MNKELIEFLSQFTELDKNLVEKLAEELIVEVVKKNTIIVNQGQTCGLCYFVLKGCLRQYILTDGIEKTIAIYTEGQAINYYTNHPVPKPSENFLSSIEESVLLVGNPLKDQEIYAKYPQLADITHKMVEVDLGKTQDSFAKFMTSSPEERYLNLLKDRPDLLQRVPQHIVASYLGVTPESLSRIRRRVHQQ